MMSFKRGSYLVSLRLRPPVWRPTYALALLNLPDEPIAPSIHALALARAHGKPRRLRIEVIECLSIPIHVKIESRSHVDLVEQLRAGVLEDARVLDGLVIAPRAPRES